MVAFASWFFVWDRWVVSLVLIVDRWNCFGYCCVLLVSLWLGGITGPLLMVVMIHFEFDLFWFIPGWSILVIVL